MAEANRFGRLRVQASENIIERITSFIPIKKAVNFGLLSSRFRDSWRYSRVLCFDREFARGRDRDDMIEAIDQVFTLHLGEKIHHFSLFFDPIHHENLVRSWISQAISKGVEYLSVDLSEGDHIRMLYDFSLRDLDDTIRVLKFVNTVVTLPPQMKGMRSLKHVIFISVPVETIAITSIFTNCMLLESLELSKSYGRFRVLAVTTNLINFRFLRIEDCYDIESVEIDAPTLTSFIYHGPSVRIKFKSIYPQLDKVVLDLHPSRAILNHSALLHTTVSLQHVKVLKLSATLLEALSPKFSLDGHYHEPQFTLPNLKEIHLVMGVTLINPSDIVSFLKNCPNLEKIFIDLGEASFEKGYYWDVQGKYRLDHCNPTFHSLKTVKVRGFKFFELEGTLVWFILEKARFLEKMVLVVARRNQLKVESEHAQQLYQQIRSWRASQSVQVEMYDYSNDKSSLRPTKIDVKEVGL